MLLGVCAAFVAGLALLTYALGDRRDPGTTSEIALLLTFGLGALAQGQPGLALGVGVAAAVILAARDPLHRFVNTVLTAGELRDALLLGSAALIVLPLLPDRAVDPFGVLNPFTLWRLAVVLMSVNALGYVLQRAVGARYGLALAGFASGFVSSLATVAAMGQRARADEASLPGTVAGAAASSVATFIQVGVLIATISPTALLGLAAPLSLGLLVTVAYAIWCALRAARSHDTVHAPVGRAFDVVSALSFAGLVSLVSLVAGLVDRWAGPTAALATAAVAGFADGHASSASVVSLGVAGKLSSVQVLLGVSLALTTNTLMKVVVAFWRGPRLYARAVTLGLMLLLLALWAGTGAAFFFTMRLPESEHLPKAWKVHATCAERLCWGPGVRSGNGAVTACMETRIEIGDQPGTVFLPPHLIGRLWRRNMYHRMLIPLDGSPCSEQAAQVGLDLAKRLGTEVCLTYVAFVFSDESPETEAARTEVRLGETLLEHWAREAQTRHLRVQTQVERGFVPKEILKVTREQHCDLVVMGTHGRSGFERFLLGSVAESVARSSNVPLLLIRPHTTERRFEPWRRVLVAVDGGPSSSDTLRHGTEMARACGASVDVVYVVPDLSIALTVSGNPFVIGGDYDRLQRDQQAYGEAVLSAARQQVEASGVPLSAAETLSTGMASGRIGDVIVEAATARRADLIVMGAHGHGGIDEMLLGSVAERVTRLASVPVLLVRGEGAGGLPRAAET